MGKRKREALTQAVETELEPESSAESATDDPRFSHLNGRVQAHKGDSDEELFPETASESSSDNESTGNVSRSASSYSEAEQSTHGSPLEVDAGLANSSHTAGEISLDAVDDRDDTNNASDLTFGALVDDGGPLDRRKSSMENRRDSDDSDEGNLEAAERKAGKGDKRDFDRTSKHAPMEQSSKKAVSRKRSVVPIQKIVRRDPRFEPAIGKVNEDQLKKNYAFLSDYRESEIAELKAGLRKTKDPVAKETLKRALTSMESRRRTEQLNEQRQEVIRQHRREEKEKVRQGKTPFYLKDSEVKERALKERFKGMKGKQREKAVERRRKKMTSKDRKNMPLIRRA